MSTIKLRNRLAGQAAIAPLATASAGEPYFNVVGWTGNGPNSLWIDDGVNLVPLVDNTRQVELAGAQSITGVKTITGTGRILFAAITNMEVVGGVAGEAILKGPGNTLVWGTGGIADAPSDTFAYGRQDAAWQRVLPLTAGPTEALTGPLTVLGDANNLGAAIGITSGVGATGNGLQLSIITASGTGANSDAGNITIRPGLATGTGAAGDIVISGGYSPGVKGGAINLSAGSSTSEFGDFLISNLPIIAQASSTAVWNNNGFLNIGAGGTVPPTYTFGTGLTDTAGTITLNQATQAVFGGGLIATNPNIAAGTLDTVLLTPLGLRGQLGADAATLVTTAKTVVPAINEIVNDIAALVGVVIFAGTYDAATNTTTPNGQGGIAGGPGPLPAASAANHGAYFINTVAGTGTAPAPIGPLGLGDWILSDGSAWLKMPFSQAPMTAANIAVNPLVLGADDVQEALENLAAASTAAGFYDPATFTGDALSAATQLVLAVVDGGTF